MKKILLTITVLFVTLLTMAQSPNLMNFQGVARNAVGNVIPNQLIGVRLSILSGGPAGSLVYQESRNVFTNAFGLFTIVMGSPGTLTQVGTIAGVNWSGVPSGAASKYLQVEIDPAGALVDPSRPLRRRLDGTLGCHARFCRSCHVHLSSLTRSGSTVMCR